MRRLVSSSLWQIKYAIHGGPRSELIAVTVGLGRKRPSRTTAVPGRQRRACCLQHGRHSRTNIASGRRTFRMQLQQQRQTAALLSPRARASTERGHRCMTLSSGCRGYCRGPGLARTSRHTRQNNKYHNISVSATQESSNPPRQCNSRSAASLRSGAFPAANKRQRD